VGLLVRKQTSGGVKRRHICSSTVFDSRLTGALYGCAVGDRGRQELRLIALGSSISAGRDTSMPGVTVDPGIDVATTERTV
jgi:hypothetical protein